RRQDQAESFPHHGVIVRQHDSNLPCHSLPRDEPAPLLGSHPSTPWRPAAPSFARLRTGISALKGSVAPALAPPQRLAGASTSILHPCRLPECSANPPPALRARARMPIIPRPPLSAPSFMPRPLSAIVNWMLPFSACRRIRTSPAPECRATLVRASCAMR